MISRLSAIGHFGLKSFEDSTERLYVSTLCRLTCTPPQSSTGELVLLENHTLGLQIMLHVTNC